MSERVWYILVDGQEEGPYSIEDLSVDDRLSADLLVWKDGFDGWRPLHSVRELRALLKDRRRSDDDEPASGDEDLSDEGPLPARLSPEGLVIDMRQEPPPTFLWVLLALALAAYLAYKLSVLS